MAEGTLQTVERSDSDEVTEMYCESCLKTGKGNVHACSFCIDCCTYYCKTCVNYHKQFLPDHSYKDHDTMPKDLCLEKCEFHTTENIKFYCGRCSEFACESCRVDNHKLCDSVHHIPSLLNEFEKNKELELFEDTLRKVEKSIDGIEVNNKHMYADMKMYREHVKMAIKEHRNDVNKHFDNLETDLEADLDKITDGDKGNLTVHFQQLSALKTKFESIKSDFVSTQRTDQKCRILMKVRRNGKNLQSMKQKLQKLSNETEIHEISYVPSDIMKSTADIGKLVIDKKEEKSKPELKAGLSLNANSILKMCAVVMILLSIIIAGRLFGRTEIVAKAEEPIVLENVGHSQPFIQDLCFFQSHYLLALDYTNNQILLISTAEKTVVSHSSTKENPRSVAKVGENIVALTFTGSANIQLMQIDNVNNTKAISWSKTEEMYFERDPLFLCYKNSKLYVLFDNKLAVMTVNGHIRKEIPLQAREFDTVMIYNESVILHSRYFDSKIDLLDMTSKTKVMTIYENKNLVLPFGMTVDNRGNVYICGYGSVNIHVLSDNLSQGRVFLNETDGITKPISIAFSHTENKLFVSSEPSSEIAVFKLS